MKSPRPIATALILAFLSFQGCSTPQPPPGGYSKEEQAAIRQEQRDRRAALRAAGLDVLQFGLSAAAGAINGGSNEGFRK